MRADALKKIEHTASVAVCLMDWCMELVVKRVNATCVNVFS